MSEKRLSVQTAEFVKRFNIVTAAGKVALGVLIPPTAPLMYTWAVLDGATAVGADVVAKKLDKKHKQ